MTSMKEALADAFEVAMMNIGDDERWPVVEVRIILNRDTTDRIVSCEMVEELDETYSIESTDDYPHTEEIYELRDGKTTKV